MNEQELIKRTMDNMRKHSPVVFTNLLEANHADYLPGVFLAVPTIEALEVLKPYLVERVKVYIGISPMDWD